MQFPLGGGAGIGGNVGVDAADGGGDAVFEQHVTKALAFFGVQIAAAAVPSAGAISLP